jgi:hypothetical protein
MGVTGQQALAVYHKTDYSQVVYPEEVVCVYMQGCSTFHVTYAHSQATHNWKTGAEVSFYPKPVVCYRFVTIKFFKFMVF